MVVTHAMNEPVLMTIAQMQEAAQATAPSSSSSAARWRRRTPAHGSIASPTRSARSASSSCILSSDLGQKANALPADGFAAFLLAMRDRGFSEQDVARMSKQNPARLLGLP